MIARNYLVLIVNSNGSRRWPIFGVVLDEYNHLPDSPWVKAQHEQPVVEM